MKKSTSPSPSTPSMSAADLARVGQLQAVERDIDARLIERSDTVRLAMVALLSRQHMTLLGAPGAAKSMMINSIADHFTPASGGGLSKFVWLMGKFTTPEEHFGPISVIGLKNDQYKRITRGRLPQAQIAFLDEPFKATSAILNTLLTLMHEREFDNDGGRVPAPLITLMGASNEMPQGDECAAIWDRFALRSTVSYVSDSNFTKLLRRVASNVPQVTMTEADLIAAQQLASSLPIPDSIIDALAQLRKDMAGKGWIASVRRWIWSLDLIRAHSLLEGKAVVDEDDLEILKYALWNRPEEERDIARMIARLANPINARAVELADQAASVYAAYTASNSNATSANMMNAALEAMTKLKKINEDLDKLAENARTEGRSLVRVERSLSQIKEMRTNLGKVLVG